MEPKPSYFLDTNLNIIKVNRITGLKVLDQPDLKTKEYTWKEGTILISDMGRMKEFKIYISKDNNLDLVIIRPREKYKDGLFEEIFDFKSLCSNYNENKIISIR
tara:strand:- start:3318 stop:3629 length:312 start_codon:yes stop_codon:yes gene_type:complete